MKSFKKTHILLFMAVSKLLVVLAMGGLLMSMRPDLIRDIPKNKLSDDIRRKYNDINTK